MSNVKFPPLLGVLNNPDWAVRARKAFSSYNDWEYSGGDAIKDPADPNSWLRCYKIGKAASEFGLQSRQYLSLAEKHLMQLEIAGVAMPDRTHRFAWGLDDRALPELTLYTKVRHIEGKTLKQLVIVDKNASMRAVRQLFKSQLAFRQWERQNAYPNVLHDKIPHKQYIFGTQTGSKQLPKFYLVDVAPELIDRTNAANTRKMCKEAENLEELAEMAEIELKDNPLRS